MRKFMITAVAMAIAGSAPLAAHAQEGTVSGAAGGAVTGAIVGGPVGAVVGGVAGAAIGTFLAPPPVEVREVVVQQNPSPVRIDGQVVVGEPLPQVVTLYPVQGYEAYAYANVNGEMVIVDPQTRAVVEVVR